MVLLDPIRIRLVLYEAKGLARAEEDKASALVKTRSLTKALKTMAASQLWWMARMDIELRMAMRKWHRTWAIRHVQAVAATASVNNHRSPQSARTRILRGKME
jgi:hypothetical protein